MRAPATNSIIKTLPTITIVVPRSRWSMTIAATISTMGPSGNARWIQLSSLPSFCVSTVAANATSESFAISEGWSVNGPSPIHRDAPYTDEPAVGWSARQQQRHRDDQQRARQPAPRGVPHAGRHQQRADPDRRVDALPLQEPEAVVVGRERVDRARGEDLDHADRREQRGGHQQEDHVRAGRPRGRGRILPRAPRRSAHDAQLRLGRERPPASR